MDVMTLQFDVAEPRIAVDRTAVLVSGEENGVIQWDMPFSSPNVFLESVTSTLMLMPNPLSQAWNTTATTSDTSSPYYRIGKASTNVAGSTSWVEHVPNNVPGNVYLYGLGTNDPVNSLASYPANQAWYFSYFSFNAGDNFLQFHGTWTGGGLTVECFIYANGQVAFTKNGNYIGGGSLSHVEHAATILGAPHKKTSNQSGAQTNVPVSFLVIPFRQRELLFICNRGGSFTVSFEDIDKSDPNPIILPACKCQWQVPVGQPMVSFAPVSYATTGYVWSQIQNLREAPASGITPQFNTLFNFTGTLGTLTIATTAHTADGSSLFTPDDTINQIRLKIDVSCDGKNSPWIYGCSAVFPAKTTTTNGAHAVTLDDYVLEAELTVPESPSGIQLTITCRNPGTIDTLIPLSQVIGNRPIAAYIGSVPYFIGRSKPPSLDEGTNDDSSKYKFELRDYWKALEIYEILDPIPWDRLGLKGVLQELGMLPGFPLSMMDIEDFDFDLPFQGQSSQGNFDYAVIPEAGDTAAKWILKLWEDYAKTCIVGWYPSITGPKLRFRNPATISTMPDATLYATTADSVAAGFDANPDSASAAWRHTVHQGYRIDTTEPEANALRVTGWDSHIDKAFQVYYRDSLSQNPTLIPSARPQNWTGERYNVAEYNSSITDMGTAVYVAGVLQQRLFYERTLAEIPCEMQFNADGSPLWRGNLLRVDGAGNFRVLTVRAQHVIENTNKVKRPCTYTGVFESV